MDLAQSKTKISIKQNTVSRADHIFYEWWKDGLLKNSNVQIHINMSPKSIIFEKEWIDFFVILHSSQWWTADINVGCKRAKRHELTKEYFHHLE